MHCEKAADPNTCYACIATGADTETGVATSALAKMGMCRLTVLQPTAFLHYVTVVAQLVPSTIIQRAV